MEPPPTATASESDAQRFDRYVSPEIATLLRVAATYTTSRSDAEDLVQDTLLRAFRAIHDFDGEHARAWLLTIMRNASINRARRGRPAASLEEPEAVVERTSSDPAVLAERTEFDDAVQRAAADLPAKFRDVVELIDLGGLSYAEAAVVLGVPVGTVMSRLHRGRRRMKQDLVARGLAPRRVDAP